MGNGDCSKRGVAQPVLARRPIPGPWSLPKTAFVISVIRKIDDFSLHTDLVEIGSRPACGHRMKTVVQLWREILLQIRCRCSKRQFADTIVGCRRGALSSLQQK